MHYILLKGSDDQSRVAVSQELKRLRKRVKELEEEIEEVKGQYDYECECNKQFVACQKENEKLKQQLEIFKLSNEALQQDNLDLSYDKADLAYEYAQEMAENWKKGYEEEIAELKQSQKQLAIDELEKAKNTIESKVENIDKRLDDLKIKIVCESTFNKISTYQEIIEIINNQIKALKGENNENI